MVHSYGGSPDGIIQIQKAAQKPGGKGTQVKVAFGFTAGMLANKMAKKARLSVQHCAMDQILLETDSPDQRPPQDAIEAASAEWGEGVRRW